MRNILAVAVLFLASDAMAQALTTVKQGPGNPSAAEWVTNGSARVAGRTTQVVVTNAAGGSYVPGGATHTPLTGRKAIEIQNLGPNPLYCTVDGTAPVVGTNGRAIAAKAADAATPPAAWSLDIGPGIVVRCIAATAAQVSGAAAMVTEVR